jgi:serine/threonine protein kinase
MPLQILLNPANDATQDKENRKKYLSEGEELKILKVLLQKQGGRQRIFMPYSNGERYKLDELELRFERPVIISGGRVFVCAEVLGSGTSGTVYSVSTVMELDGDDIRERKAVAFGEKNYDVNALVVKTFAGNRESANREAHGGLKYPGAMLQRVAEGEEYFAIFSQKRSGMTLTKLRDKLDTGDIHLNFYQRLCIVRGILQEYSYLIGEILHNDLSPDNILIKDKKIVQFIDFGAATNVSSAPEERSEWPIIDPLTGDDIHHLPNVISEFHPRFSAPEIKRARFIEGKTFYNPLSSGAKTDCASLGMLFAYLFFDKEGVEGRWLADTREDGTASKSYTLNFDKKDFQGVPEPIRSMLVDHLRGLCNEKPEGRIGFEQTNLFFSTLFESQSRKKIDNSTVEQSEGESENFIPLDDETREKLLQYSLAPVKVFNSEYESKLQDEHTVGADYARVGMFNTGTQPPQPERLQKLFDNVLQLCTFVWEAVIKLMSPIMKLIESLRESHEDMWAHLNVDEEYSSPVSTLGSVNC